MLHHVLRAAAAASSAYPRLDLLFPETRPDTRSRLPVSVAFVPETRARPSQFECFIRHPDEEVTPCNSVGRHTPARARARLSAENFVLARNTRPTLLVAVARVRCPCAIVRADMNVALNGTISTLDE